MIKIVSRLIVMAAVCVGCASAPRWTDGAQPNPYYYQGVGQGESPESASLTALVALAAEIRGTTAEVSVEDYRREHGSVSESRMEEDFRRWIRSRSDLEIPPNTKVVDRWSGGGREWAYAVLEKPGKKQEINRLFREHMRGFVAHSFVPGWAQFQQRRNRAAWSYITGVGAGLITGVVAGSMSADRVARRDLERIQEMRDYYDDQANQYYWLSVAGYALAGISYGINILDGQTIRVEPYHILTQRPGPGVRVALNF